MKETKGSYWYLEKQGIPNVIRIILLIVVIFILIVIVFVVSSKSSPPKIAEPEKKILTDTQREQILNTPSDIPLQNPKLTDAQRLQILSGKKIK